MKEKLNNLFKKLIITIMSLIILVLIYTSTLFHTVSDESSFTIDFMQSFYITFGVISVPKPIEN